jgi:hypothetical protein
MQRMMLGLSARAAAGAAGSARLEVSIEMADTARIAKEWRIFISVSSVVRRRREVAWDTRGGGVIFPAGWKNARPVLSRCLHGRFRKWVDPWVGLP